MKNYWGKYISFDSVITLDTLLLMDLVTTNKIFNKIEISLKLQQNLS